MGDCIGHLWVVPAGASYRRLQSTHLPLHTTEQVKGVLTVADAGASLICRINR